MTNFDVVIIGAGPSGSVSAASLLKNGLRVLVIEKETFPRFVIGESLLPRCMEHLHKLDLIAPIEKYGFQTKHGAIFFDPNNKACDFDFANQFTKDAWSWTWQVPRAEFDKALADEVEKRGAEILYNTTVTNVVIENKVVQTTYADKQGNTTTVTSRFIIDASGYGRVLPRLFDLNTHSTLSEKASYFAHISNENSNPELRGKRISIIAVSDEIWSWNIPFSNGTNSVGFVAEEKYLNPDNLNVHDNLIRLLETSAFYKKFYTAPFELKRPATCIKGYSVGVKQMYGEGYVLTGNSTEFLDPIFSSGVCFAIESGAKAAELVYQELNGELVDWEKDYSDYMKFGIDTFKSYVEAWYNCNLHKIFFNDKQDESIKREISSVLAGYAWDQSNPFVKKHKTVLSTLAKVLEM